MAPRASIDPKSLAFTDEAPPTPTFGQGERKSPYAEMVANLMSKPGKWAKSPGNARKAEKIHFQFPGIERRTSGDDLWLRYVTTEIVAAECVAEYTAPLDGTERTKKDQEAFDAKIAALTEIVTKDVHEAGMASKTMDGKKLTRTEFFVTAMFDAGRTSVRTNAVKVDGTGD